MRVLSTDTTPREEVLSLLRRSLQLDDPQIEAQVRNIVQDVATRGDDALFEYTARFDGVQLSELEVSASEFDSTAREQRGNNSSILLAAERIKAFHELQRRKSWFDFSADGSFLGQLITPLRRVGIYVPGGTAAYPSTVLMCAIPARVAGVEEIILCTPPRKDGTVNPSVLLAAAEARVNRVFKVGGAQAIAAMAYGTQTIPQVDKIVGPGNIYVTIAKKLVYGIVGIDMLAGPSEVCVVADESANPHFVSIDMITQAEHDVNSAAFLLTPSRELAEAVQEDIQKSLTSLPRKEIVQEALEKNGGIIITRHIDEAIELANICAPEHLALMVKEPLLYLPCIRCAGAVMIGGYSPQSLGDYIAGPSHTLPTSGTARFSSPLNVDDFIKKTSVIHFTLDALRSVKPHIEEMAQHEQLEAHRQAVSRRFQS